MWGKKKGNGVTRALREARKGTEKRTSKARSRLPGKGRRAGGEEWKQRDDHIFKRCRRKHKHTAQRIGPNVASQKQKKRLSGQGECGKPHQGEGRGGGGCQGPVKSLAPGFTIRREGGIQRGSGPGIYCPESWEGEIRREREEKSSALRTRIKNISLIG